MSRVLLVGLLLCSWGVAPAAERVYAVDVEAPMEQVYADSMLALEDMGFAVVAELNIGAGLAKKAWRWGANYNRNRYTEVRSMVLCHPEHANEVLNQDPVMMAMCPVTLTVLYKEGVTSLLFDRPSYGIAADNPAYPVLARLEEDFIAALERVHAQED